MMINAGGRGTGNGSLAEYYSPDISGARRYGRFIIPRRHLRCSRSVGFSIHWYTRTKLANEFARCSRALPFQSIPACDGERGKERKLYRLYREQRIGGVFLSRLTESKFHWGCRNGHMLTHRNKKPYECKAEGCGKSYCDARSLRRHTENHHAGSKVNESVSPSSPTTGPHTPNTPGSNPSTPSTPGATSTTNGHAALKQLLATEPAQTQQQKVADRAMRAPRAIVFRSIGRFCLPGWRQRFLTNVSHDEESLRRVARDSSRDGELRMANGDSQD